MQYRAQKCKEEIHTAPRNDLSSDLNIYPHESQFISKTFYFPF